jgi:hypothetical protein
MTQWMIFCNQEGIFSISRGVRPTSGKGPRIVSTTMIFFGPFPDMLCQVGDIPIGRVEANEGQWASALGNCKERQSQRKAKGKAYGKLKMKRKEN